MTDEITWRTYKGFPPSVAKIQDQMNQLLAEREHYQRRLKNLRKTWSLYTAFGKDLEIKITHSDVVSAVNAKELTLDQFREEVGCDPFSTFEYLGDLYRTILNIEKALVFNEVELKKKAALVRALAKHIIKEEIDASRRNDGS